jgi:KDO2-lipid IV(A) lauroyltransferase
MAVCLGYFFCYFTPFRKKIIRQQIKKTLGPDMSEKEVRRLVRKNYVHYACVLFESLILFSIDLGKSSYIEKHFTAPEGDLLKKAVADGKGVILIGAHMGFWEAIGAYCVRNAAPVTVAVKIMKSGFVQAVREEMQSHPDMHLVDGRMGRQRIIALLTALRNGEIVGLFLDQYRPAEDFVPFLGKDARTNSTAALLWRKTRAKVLLVHVLRRKFGDYLIDFQAADPGQVPESTDAREYTRAINAFFNERMGAVIRAYPDQWFWAHRRFKENPEFDYS